MRYPWVHFDYKRTLPKSINWNPRVSYRAPAKWIAKLRANQTDKNLLLLKTKMESGHFGATGRYDELKDTAFEYAFIFKVLGIKE